MSSQAAPGWYADPNQPGQQRYWDGTRWTEHTAPGAGAQQAAAAPAQPAPAAQQPAAPAVAGIPGAYGASPAGGGYAMGGQVTMTGTNEVQLPNTTGKIRNFWGCIGLGLITFGIYFYIWYYSINNELKGIGMARGDQVLGNSNPGMSLLSLFVPIAGIISHYNTCDRIRQAETLVGIDPAQRINPTGTFLLLFPGLLLLLIPVFFYYASITKHVNAALRAAAGQAPFET